MRRLVVGDAARADLRNIADFTESRWGAAQRRRYLSALSEAFRRLQRNPILGRDRADIQVGFRSLLVERHVVFFRFDELECEIVRVLHDRMDIHRVIKDE